MRIIILGGIAATSASVSAGLWAYNGSPMAFAMMVFLSFCTLGCFVQRLTNFAVQQAAVKAAALLRSEGRSSAKTLDAAGTLADTLVTQDQVTADALVAQDQHTADRLIAQDKDTADRLIAQDQQTADTLEEADRDVTRNVRSKDE